MGVTFKSKISHSKESPISLTHFLTSKIPVEDNGLSPLAIRRTPLSLKRLLTCSWADFENPFIGKGVDPQNTWNSPPSDLGLFGQFNKLYAKTNGSFNLMLSNGNVLRESVLIGNTCRMMVRIMGMEGILLIQVIVKISRCSWNC